MSARCSLNRSNLALSISHDLLALFRCWAAPQGRSHASEGCVPLLPTGHHRSGCPSTPLSASGKPEVIAPAWAPTSPNSFPSKQGLVTKKQSSHSLGFNSCSACQSFQCSSQGLIKEKPDQMGPLKRNQIRWAKACPYLGHSSGVYHHIPA